MTTDQMNEAQTLQQKKLPNWKPNEVNVVSLTYVIDDSRLTSIERIKCCKTLATSLDEAVKRARRKYGPGHLNAWGLSSLPEEGWLHLGGGELLRGKHDKHHKEDLRRMGH